MRAQTPEMTARRIASAPQQFGGCFANREDAEVRFAVVRGARSADEVGRYLPDSYGVMESFVEVDGGRESLVVIIGGQDFGSGWSLENYVIPRLASGSMSCEEIADTSTSPAPVYFVDDVQAVEPESLVPMFGCEMEVAQEVDSMGFPRVTITGPSREAVASYVRAQWMNYPDPDEEWFQRHIVDRIVAVEPPLPDGFRRVSFTDDDGEDTYEGIVRVGAESSSAGLMPFVSVLTMERIAADLHRVFPTVRDAAEANVEWFEVVPMVGGFVDVVVYNLPDPGEVVEYDGDGYPVDGNAWGTINLFDQPGYDAAHPQPSRDWVDLGALGLVWHEKVGEEI